MITNSDDTERRRKAAALVENAGEWQSFVDGTGRRTWSIPSTLTPGRRYKACADLCSCDDARYHPWRTCKHSDAIRLFLELEAAEYAF